jgi:glycosyltransferase involved in cell wall biosynthesis
MKIAYVLSQFPVISQTFVMNEIVELIAKGHEVFIFSLSRPRGAGMHREVSKYFLIERTHYFPVVSCISSDMQEPGPRLASLGSQVYGPDSFGGRVLNLICRAAVAPYFARLAERLKIEVLHAHFYGMASSLAALVSGRTGIPFTYTCHAVDIFVAPRPRVMRRHMDAASRIITPSEYNKEYLMRLTGIPSGKIEVIRACHAIDKFKAVQRRENGRVIISTGRLVEKKGIAYAISALQTLVGEFPDLRYRIIGNGPEKRKIQDLVKSLNLEMYVELLDRSGHTSFMQNLAIAAFMVLPCVRTEEGDMDVCPLVLQEAMCSGVPVLSTNISAIPELIENGVEGLVVPPNDVYSLAAAMRSLLKNEDLREQMGQAGRRKMDDKFNIHEEVDKLLTVWKEAIGASAYD